MYEIRFIEEIPKDLVLKQIRGLEGRRVRNAYLKASKKTGVVWNGRNYKHDWSDTDEINKLLSIANSCLYGVCHSAIISLGYSPSLGFIHTGKQLSFVYDIADLYKAETTIPVSFEICSKEIAFGEKMKELRTLLREKFHEEKVLKRIPEDLNYIFKNEEEVIEYPDELPAEIWNIEENISGGQNFSE
jgi:CRISPR-associated protein Cas1